MSNDSTGVFNTNPPSIQPLMTTMEPEETNHENDVADIETGGSTEGPYCCSYRIIELILCCIPVPIGVILELHSLFEPHQRPIPYQIVDETIVNAFMYNVEDTGETVPPAAMFCTAVAIPFVLQLLLIGSCCKLPRSDLIHKTCCVYALAIGLTQTLTNAAKLYVGYFRPIFLDHCQPDENFECTSTYKTEQQSRVSFPSGHASMSVCGLLLFSYFLADTFGYSAKSKSTTSPKLLRIVEVLCYAPMLVAYFIALSRVHDNHHHPADVVGGSLLGGVIATFVYNIWFS